MPDFEPLENNPEKFGQTDQNKTKDPQTIVANGKKNLTQENLHDESSDYAFEEEIMDKKKERINKSAIPPEPQSAKNATSKSYSVAQHLSGNFQPPGSPTGEDFIRSQIPSAVHDSTIVITILSKISRFQKWVQGK